jgi:hypothetical protein
MASSLCHSLLLLYIMQLSGINIVDFQANPLLTMTIKNLFLVLLFPVLGSAQTNSGGKPQTTIQDANGKRPDFQSMVYTDIKWKKSDSSTFWFYYKPTHYFFTSKEFQTIPLETGDYLIYIFEMRKYVLLPGYVKADTNVEHDIEIATNSDCVFFRLSRGRFYIFDKGLYVDNLESVGLNNTYRQYVYRSRRTDKRYFIDEKDFSYGLIGKPVGIFAE